MPRVELPGSDTVAVVAANPSLFTLTGTNTWIVGREPAWVIDPGPSLPEHLDRVSAEIDERGGLGAILLTHNHRDHADALPELALRFSPVPVGAMAPVAGLRGADYVALQDGDRAGPFEVIATGGHSPDHLAFLGDDGVLYSGDAVLGVGSVFVAPSPGSLAGYLAALDRAKARSPRLIAPGHGPIATDGVAKLGEYIDHRQDRERQILAAFDAGVSSVDGLLTAIWSDAPAALRSAALLTLAAHLDKLADDGRLPPGVERPDLGDGWPEV